MRWRWLIASRDLLGMRGEASTICQQAIVLHTSVTINSTIFYTSEQSNKRTIDVYDSRQQPNMMLGYHGTLTLNSANREGGWTIPPIFLDKSFFSCTVMGAVGTTITCVHFLYLACYTLTYSIRPWRAWRGPPRLPRRRRGHNREKFRTNRVPIGRYPKPGSTRTVHLPGACSFVFSAGVVRKRTHLVARGRCRGRLL